MWKCKDEHVTFALFLFKSQLLTKLALYIYINYIGIIFIII